MSEEFLIEVVVVDPPPQCTAQHPPPPSFPHTTTILLLPQFRLFADSLYFVSTTLTTVGFGDLHPEGQYERLFMVFYILAGLVVVGAVVGDAVGYVLESAMDGLAEQDYEWLELQAGGGPAQSEGGGGAVHAANGKNAGNGKKVGSPVDEGGARHEGGRANGKNVAGEGGGGGGRMVGDGGDGGGRMVVATASPRPSLGTTQLFTGVEVKNDLSSDEGEEGDHSFLVRRAADVLSRQSSKNSKEGAVSKKRVAGRSVGEREEGVFGKKIRQRKPGAGEHNKSCTPDAPLLSLLKPLYVPKPPPHKKLSRADRKRSLDQHLLLIGAVRKIRLLFFFLFPLLFGAFVVFLFERAPSSSDGGGGNPNPDGGADGAGDGWTFIDGLYWATTVASTVGYGDPAPKNISTRIFSIFYLLLATACLGVVVSRYAQLQVRLLLLKKRIEFNHLEDEEFGDLLAQYDVDGNRRIEKVEFLSACLVGMAKVSAAEVEEILAKFDELDRDRSGAIGIEDMRSRSGLIGPEN